MAVVCVLAVAGAAGARLDTHADPTGDAPPGALDINAVKVDDTTSGYFEIEVDTVQTTFSSTDAISAFLDTDRNLTDDANGAEYQLYVQGGAGGTCGLYRWNGTNWGSPIRTNVCIAGSSLFRFLRSDIGNPLDFRVHANTWYGGPPPTTSGDRAPDTGWWLFDDTPPNTSITSGPTGSTTSTSASFTFLSTEASSTFKCSIDGHAYASCSSPVFYPSLGLGAHSFQVVATDPSGNHDPSPASRSWTVIAPPDTTPPTVEVTKANCCSKGEAAMYYTLGDNSGLASIRLSIRRSGKIVKTCPYGQGASGTYNAIPCKVPTRARGWLRGCAQAKDAAGNTSPLSCKPLSFRRIKPSLTLAGASANGVILVTAFKLTGRAGGKVTVTCPGCMHFSPSHPVGTRLPPGASMEVRVVKPLFIGAVIGKKNVGGGLVPKKDACLPPGQLKPQVSCKRSH